MRKNIYIILISITIAFLYGILIIYEYLNHELTIVGLIVDLTWLVFFISLPASICYCCDSLKYMSFEEGFDRGFSAGLALGFGGFITLTIIVAPFFALKYIRKELSEKDIRSHK